MNQLSKSDYAKTVCEALLAESYFGSPGAGGPQDGKVSRSVMRVVAQTVQQPKGVTGTEVAAQRTDAGALTSAKFRQRLAAVYGAAAADEIDVAFLGETHNDAADATRVTDWIAAVTGGTVAAPTFVIRERGMNYATGTLACPVVREEDLTSSPNAPTQYLAQYAGNWGIGLSVDQRSMVVAGYLAMCLAASPQDARERVVIVFGERHANIVTQYLEYFIRHTVPWVANRPRNYLVVSSTA